MPYTGYPAQSETHYKVFTDNPITQGVAVQRMMTLPVVQGSVLLSPKWGKKGGKKPLYTHISAPGSSVGIGSGYGLDNPGIESQWR